MSRFPFSGQTPNALDPFKRVKYSLGLVLGVEEFEQEQSYVRQRLDWHHLLMHGAGTVYGLGVSLEGHRVTVNPGLALDNQGRLVRVHPAQWASIDEWLSVPANLQALKEQPLVGNVNQLWVVLRYAEEPADPVAFPGPSERPHEQLLTPSRIAETFELTLSLERPDTAEGHASRQLGDLFSRMEVVETGGIDEAVIADQLRNIAGGGGASRRKLSVARDKLESVVRAALRVWVTEVLPVLRPEGAQAGDPGLPLARLDLQLGEDGHLVYLALDERERPYVLPARLVQEMILRRMVTAENPRGRGKAEAAVAALLSPAPLTVMAPPPQATPADAAAPPPADATAPAPEAPSVPDPAPAAHVTPFVSISRLWAAAEPTFQLCFHGQQIQQPIDVTVYTVRDTYGFDFIRPNRPVTITHTDEAGENVFNITLDDEAAGADHFRFDFDLRNMQTRSGRKLTEMAQSGEVNWLGFDGSRKVTAFFGEPRPVTTVVAAGAVRADGRVRGTGLSSESEGNGLYRLTFSGYRPEGLYIVRGTPMVGLSDPPHLFEVLGGHDERGLMVRVITHDGQPGTVGFLVEISRVNEDAATGR